jgi:hypothetical protein
VCHKKMLISPNLRIFRAYSRNNNSDDQHAF